MLQQGRKAGILLHQEADWACSQVLIRQGVQSSCDEQGIQPLLSMA